MFDWSQVFGRRKQSKTDGTKESMIQKELYKLKDMDWIKGIEKSKTWKKTNSIAYKFRILPRKGKIRTFREIEYSMSSGITYSPPLYANFLCRFPTVIEDKKENMREKLIELYEGFQTNIARTKFWVSDRPTNKDRFYTGHFQYIQEENVNLRKALNGLKKAIRLGRKIGLCR